MERRHMDLLGWYTTKEAADRAGVCVATLRKYIRNGWVEGCEKLPGKAGRYRIRKDPFDAWVERSEHEEAAA